MSEEVNVMSKNLRIWYIGQFECQSQRISANSMLAVRKRTPGRAIVSKGIPKGFESRLPQQISVRHTRVGWIKCDLQRASHGYSKVIKDLEGELALNICTNLERGRRR